MKKYFLLLLLFFSFKSFPQAESSGYFNVQDKYAAIDAHAKKVKYKSDLALLSDELTRGYASDLDKVRAIFIWITDNVAYDYKFVNKKKKIKFAKCKKGEDCGKVQKEWENKFLHKVITRKKSICEGYARLFKRLCDEAGIQSSVVSGYTKQEPQLVGKMGNHDHAWNAVLIDGKYYFLDVTWAAGSCTKNEKGKLDKFYKGLNDYYWCTPAEKLYRNHFPKDSIWLKDSGYTKERYRDNAYIRGDLMESLDIIEPASGVIDAKVGDTIHFKVRDTDGNDLLKYSTNLRKNPNLLKVEDWESKEYEDKLKKQQYLPFRRNNDLLEFDYVIDNKNIRYIDIIFDHAEVMRFNIKIVESR